MPSFEARHEKVYRERAAASRLNTVDSEAVAAVAWACLASTLLRVRRGEGALLAVNLSLILAAWTSAPRAAFLAIVSALAIVQMYAFNDLCDAPTDSSNPRKSRRLIGTYLEHRAACGAAILGLSILTVVLAFATVGWRAGSATTAVMLVNVAYSRMLKGIPVLDVAWCGLWGALYAAIVTASLPLLLMVALMTAVCHLYQTIGDRAPDAANEIMTTAVRSSALATGVLLVLSILLLAILRGPIGGPSAATAFVPFGLLFIVAPHTGWLLSKVYFAAVWLHVLMVAHALH